MSDWDAHHTKDPLSESGMGYDRDARIHTAQGNHDRYWGVMSGLEDRATFYAMAFVPDTAREAALAQVAEELPIDLQIVWQKALTTCYSVEYRSATLAHAIPRDEGYVYISLYHYDSAGNYARDTRFVDDAAFVSGRYLSASQSPGC